jgi:hypothetical protein
VAAGLGARHVIVAYLPRLRPALGCSNCCTPFRRNGPAHVWSIRVQCAPELARGITPRSLSSHVSNIQWLRSRLSGGPAPSGPCRTPPGPSQAATTPRGIVSLEAGYRELDQNDPAVGHESPPEHCSRAPHSSIHSPVRPCSAGAAVRDAARRSYAVGHRTSL